MFGSRLFRSRWSALFWAGGILWTAYDVADAAGGANLPGTAANAASTVDATGVAADARDLAILAGAGNAD